VALVSAATVAVGSVGPASADSYVPISGAGSTWSANALDQWIADVQQYGMQVNFAPTGSSDGRSEFLQGTVDFAASDIPFQSHPEDGSAPEDPAAGSYAYIPVTAGGTAFMYNLTINGQRVTNLRLSGQNVAKIFTGQLTNWDDPAIAADNPQLTLPNRTIVPVVRSDGSGSTAQFSLWMISQYASIWNTFCHAVGRAPACGETSFYPTSGNMIAQSGDLGVAGYVAQGYADGAIGYVNYSYALNAKFPVVKVLNAAGYYTEPTPNNVAVSLLQAQVDTTDVNDPSLYLTQQLGSVYTDNDPRTYPLSSYSYMIMPIKVQGQFTQAKGKTLGAFAYYAMCQGQQESASLGYSPMPYNLVQDSFQQITKIPGVVVENVNVQSCNNPTFSTTSPNLLAQQAPQPQACDKQGATQCATGTAGDQNPTTLNGGSSSSSGSGSGSTGGGSGTSSQGSGSASAGSSSAAHGTSGATGSSGSSHTVVTRPRGATGSGAARSGTGSSPQAPASTIAGCDPSAGTCGATSGGATSAAVGGSNAPALQASSSDGSGTAAAAVATPTTLPAHSGWTGLTLALLIALLTILLVLAPGVTSLYMSRRSE
jgi:phosphate ABC transporter phosphate-binding protein